MKTIYQTLSFKTREVMVGPLGVGGNNPVRVQSMTTSPTDDVEATVDQITRLYEAGCEIARVTVQGMKEAKACEHIKNALIQKNIPIPLVADIHFFPKAALTVADFVDKVRINPGNFADKRAQFLSLEYTETSYAQELEKIEAKFAPLVEKCKKLKRAMRIGVNHGSLSDRIMSWYGDTPKGMVESAIEYAEVARKYDYHDLIFSMKASNPKVMVASYRLLVARMLELGWDYPLHLGVTEAGEGEDGRVKSAIGSGTLLLEGLGDTLRISLTEAPWAEIAPCKQLLSFTKERVATNALTTEHKRRKVEPVKHKAWHPGGVVLLKSAISTFPAKRVSENREEWSRLKLQCPPCILFAPTTNRVANTRALIHFLEENELHVPVILAFSYECSPDELPIQAGAEVGSLLCDGYGEGVYLQGDYPQEMLEKLSLTILQGARMRLTKAEFISCPGCGRTLFDLQEVAARIRAKTGHLAGVKIAIMGCIVNGPGEMADADFGFVGSKPGKIDLFFGKERVKKDIAMQDAEEELIALIKEKNQWQNPTTQTN